MTPPTPDAIGQQLAALQREKDAAMKSLRDQYHARMAELHAQWIRAITAEAAAGINREVGSFATLRSLINR